MTLTGVAVKWEVHETAFINEAFRPLNENIRPYLMKKIRHEDDTPSGAKGFTPEGKTMLYVLGGAQRSLEPRFRTAAMLFHQEIARKIFLLDAPGITEYSSELGRNLTHNEWSQRQLEQLGLQPADVEFVSIDMGYFGTLAEARGVSNLILRGHYKRLVLVTSSYHTQRVWITFLHFLARQGVRVSICGSTERERTGNLLFEYIKLIVYQYVVIPFFA